MKSKNYWRGQRFLSHTIRRKKEKTRSIITFTPFSNPVTTLTPTNFIHTLVQIGKQNNKKLILHIDKFWTHCFSSWKYVVKWAILAQISTLCVHVFVFLLLLYLSWTYILQNIKLCPICNWLNKDLLCSKYFFFFSSLMMLATFIYIFQVIIIYINSSFHSKPIRFTHSFHKLGSSVFFSLSWFYHILPSASLFCLVILSCIYFLIAGNWEGAIIIMSRDDFRLVVVSVVSRSNWIFFFFGLDIYQISMSKHS